MKKITLFAAILVFLSCNSKTILDKQFQYKFYENLDYEKLLREKTVSEDDLFLINYTILRQRDYRNYTIEGKTYGEILDMAKSFKQNGFPVEEKLSDNAEPSEIIQKVDVSGSGLARKAPGSKRLIKTLKFSCSYSNPTKKDIVLLNSSFVVRGPFGDYLTTINYEVNCIVPANQKVEFNCIVPGKVLQKNILFEGNPNIRRIGIDALLYKMNVEPTGLTLKSDSQYFKDCFLNDASLEPHQTLNLAEFAKANEGWKTKNADGTYILNFGNKHIPDESDEVIIYR